MAEGLGIGNVWIPFERKWRSCSSFEGQFPKQVFTAAPLQLRSQSPCPGSAGRKALDLCQR